MLPILNQSFWRDEAFSALLASYDPWTIVQLTSKDVSPPLYYILLHYWILLFGNNEVILRSFSFLIHVVGVVIVFFLMRKLTASWWAPVLTTFAVFLNPFLIQYAFEARQYSLLWVFTLLGVYAMLYRKHVFSGLFFGLAIYTHNFGLFSFAAVCVWYVYKYRLTHIRHLVALVSMPLLFLVMWGSVIWNQWEHVAREFWIKPATTALFEHSLAMYTKGDLSFSLQPLLYLLALGLLFFAGAYWVSYKHEEKTDVSLLTLVGLLPVFMTYIISAYFAPIYHERYLIATVPLVIIIVGYSLFLLYRKTPHIRHVLLFLIGMYCVVLLQGSEKIMATTTKPAINWGVKQVMTQGNNGDIVIATPINFLELKYYAKRYNKDIHPYVYVPKGEIPFYIGKILFEEKDILRVLPQKTTVWKIEQDGGYRKLQGDKKK